MRKIFEATGFLRFPGPWNIVQEQLNWVEMTVSQSNLESDRHRAGVWGQRWDVSGRNGDEERVRQLTRIKI